MINSTGDANSPAQLQYTVPWSGTFSFSVRRTGAAGAGATAGTGTAGSASVTEASEAGTGAAGAGGGGCSVEAGQSEVAAGTDTGGALIGIEMCTDRGPPEDLCVLSCGAGTEAMPSGAAGASIAVGAREKAWCCARGAVMGKLGRMRSGPRPLGIGGAFGISFLLTRSSFTKQ